MSQRFSQKEAMVASWYLILYIDEKQKEVGTKIIKDKLMEKYDLWSIIDWDRFIEKWTKWVREDGYEKILNHCKKILDDADYSVRIKTLAGMWAISVDIGDEKWSDGESEYYLAMEKALKVKREDVTDEWRKI
jgi:hypothetical protein|tara:strand:- start:460 stop:858 length:399 start_codon:yes stop_codon:yes gene_type:complete